MAYNKFKRLAQLQDDLGISSIQAAWLPSNISSKGITDLLKVILQEASQEMLTTEKAKSEYIIVPIRNEPRRQNIVSSKLFRVLSLRLIANAEIDRGLAVLQWILDDSLKLQE